MYVYSFDIAAANIWLRIINLYKDVIYVQLCMCMRYYISIHNCMFVTHTQAHSWKCSIKVLSMEMDPAEIRFIILQVVIKEGGGEILEKSAPLPYCESPLLKLHAPSRTAAGYLETYCQRRTQICERPSIYYIQLFATALWTNLKSVCNNAMSILSLECCYSLLATVLWCSAILAAAQWTPLQYWQRRNELLHNIGNCRGCL